jgi:hypothetical protein
MRILKPVIIVVVAVIALWLLSGAVGFSMALGASLLLSVGLTLLLNLVFAGRRR